MERMSRRERERREGLHSLCHMTWMSLLFFLKQLTLGDYYTNFNQLKITNNIDSQREIVFYINKREPWNDSY